MLKSDELSDPNSCINKARNDERLFVLFATAIRAWRAERIRLRKNTSDDPQIIEAMDCADRMDIERSRINFKPHGGGMAGHDED